MLSTSRLILRNKSLLRPSSTLIRAAQPTLRSYATSTRKAVTIVNDDGRINWGDLSTREKAARTTQQTFNLAVVVVGVLMTGAVATFLFLDVFSPHSYTTYFNYAVSKLRAHADVTSLLGPASSLTFYGEPQSNKWTRNRPIAHRLETDKFGVEHMYMDFNAEGEKGIGRVHAHLVRRGGKGDFEWRFLWVDVRGGERIYLEREEQKGGGKGSGRIFGVRWW
ncbi:import inner membrane translocase-like protein subunit tim-21 [Pseudovirgaria hyperparasitica]|uniref:Mitochondrial import inner membrane translocase subunit Tim21 n=1 Tax=Pseudovirgaria hyperparasitica TaxID=470096 RepID=A0A6A6WLA8_9PEZI|nr:import inner membrane translocase-like protein subunit tim-21 [Pseudovirgaria hyperparasitica]KAF2763000.1 import inner membrane translocase-like protein subunit tim-21 [Pseudovirgaria hyperparasitica]